MGSSSSKSFDPDTAARPPVPAIHRRSFSRNVFQSSCVRPAYGSPDSSDIDDDDIDEEQVSNHQGKENNNEGYCAKETESKLKGKMMRNRNGTVKQTDERACISSEKQIGEWGESSMSDTVSRNGSSSSQNPSSHFLSRFSFFNGSISSRLSRATSSRSSRAYPESSTSSTISNDEGLHSGRFGSRNRTQGCDFFPSCFMPSSLGPQDSDSDSDNSEISSSPELPRDIDNIGVESNGNLYSPRTVLVSDGIETRHVHRRNGDREPVERNVRFSRTLSVGRLRDRVLRRSAFPELQSCPLQPEREVADDIEDGETRSHLSNENALTPITTSSYSPSIMPGSLYGGQDFDVETTHVRETRYQDLLEHRSTFLERRRRIRSQVRALQRMGSRFENLSGHERSCILYGHHRTGQCACRLSNRDQSDGTNARASISRIVLLAEALFEVLDEIHQQSIALSSRPSLSSIGSVPAPAEVVEALPVKLYRKSLKQLNEEDTQCYICLVEYEDGDEIRTLPCRHEFHKSCIDKWLKEIHRICPLCRGDVCKSESVAAEC